MLRDRNETSHIYDEKTARRIYDHIRANVPELRRVHGLIVEKTSD